MKKKEYEQPKTDVVKLKYMPQLLMGSKPDYIPEEWNSRSFELLTTEDYEE